MQCKELLPLLVGCISDPFAKANSRMPLSVSFLGPTTWTMPAGEVGTSPVRLIQAFQRRRVGGARTMRSLELIPAGLGPARALVFPFFVLSLPSVHLHRLLMQGRWSVCTGVQLRRFSIQTQRLLYATSAREGRIRQRP